MMLEHVDKPTQLTTLASIAMPIVYFLSIGPFIWLTERLGLSMETTLALATPYIPVMWLSERWATLDTFLDWYVTLWP